MAENIQGSSNNQEKTLKEIQECIKETVNKVTENEGNTPNSQLINDRNELAIENEAYRRRKLMVKEWRKKRNERRNAFESFTRCEILADLYGQWIEQDIPYIPRKFRHKQIKGEEESETELRKQLDIEKVKTEIKLLQQRKTKFEKKFSDIDQTMLEHIEESANGSVAEKLRDIWMKDCNGDIEKVRNSWQKKKEWFQKTKEESETDQETSDAQEQSQMVARRNRSIQRRQEAPGNVQRRQGTSIMRQKAPGSLRFSPQHQGGKRYTPKSMTNSRRYGRQANHPRGRSKTRRYSQQRKVKFNFNPQQQRRGRPRYSQSRSPGNRKTNHYGRRSQTPFNRNQQKVGQSTSHFFQQPGLPQSRR